MHYNDNSLKIVDIANQLNIPLNESNDAIVRRISSVGNNSNSDTEIK